MFFKKKEFIFEEGIKLPKYGEKISKKLNVFYNPVMKLNRDISILVIKSYFEDDKKIKFCDPMSASGIREMRFLKIIPNKFEKITMGDISREAIKNIKKNFKLNKLKLDKIELIEGDALNTISKQYYNFIEIDPFGSPIPFLDIASQRIKHGGILSVTATDTAPLSGTYPKTAMRKYGIQTQKVFWHEELGVRNLIAYTQRQTAKYDKIAIPILSYSNEHYFKVFFRIEDGRTNALNSIKNLKFISSNISSQDLEILEIEKNDDKENLIMGKTYIGKLNDKEFLKKIISNLDLIEDNKKISKLLNSIENEIDTIGHYNTHKLQKKFKFSSQIKFETLIEKLIEKGFETSRPHNNRLGIKTKAKASKIVEIMKDYPNQNKKVKN